METWQFWTLPEGNLFQVPADWIIFGRIDGWLSNLSDAEPDTHQILVDEGGGRVFAAMLEGGKFRTSSGSWPLPTGWQFLPLTGYAQTREVAEFIISMNEMDAQRPIESEKFKPVNRITATPNWKGALDAETVRRVTAATAS